MRGTLSKILTMVLLVALALLILPSPLNYVVGAAFVSAVCLFDASILCMTSRNLSQNLAPLSTLYPVVHTASKVVDVWIPIAEYDAIMLVSQTGAVVGAGLGIPLARHADSAAGAGAADCAAADLEGAFVATAANQLQKVGYKGSKAFVGLAYTHTSGTSVAMGGIVVRGRPHLSPQPFIE